MSLIVLFASSFAAATILPLSSEIPLALVVSRSHTWLLPVLVATLGNVLGACTTYWLGRMAVKIAPASPRAEKARTLLGRYGAPTMLLSWVPVVGDLLVVIAGAARIPFGWFAIWTTIGKLARYVVVALAARSL